MVGRLEGRQDGYRLRLLAGQQSREHEQSANQ
jgi:hypothetical protein